MNQALYAHMNNKRKMKKNDNNKIKFYFYIEQIQANELFG
jgi:hypothetical protein